MYFPVFCSTVILLQAEKNSSERDEFARMVPIHIPFSLLL